MTLYTLNQRLERASRSSDFVEIAHSYAMNGNVEEALRLCNKACEVATHFYDHLEIAWSLHKQAWPDTLLHFGKIYQKSLLESEKGLDQLLEEAADPDFDFLNQFDFLACARYYHSMGRESASFKAFSVTYRIERDNSFFDFMEMAHSIRSLRWEAEAHSVQELVDDLASSIRACLQLPTTDLLYFEDELAFDFQDLADAGKQALDIGWIKMSTACFERSLQEITQRKESPTERQKLSLDVVYYFAAHPSLSKWALEHYEQLLRAAEQREALEILAPYLPMFRNATTEAELCRLILEKEPSLFNTNEVLFSFCLDLQDSELKYHLIGKAIQQSSSAIELLKVVKELHGQEAYTDLFDEAVTQLDQKPDYLNAILEEYAVEHNLPAEEFSSRLQQHASAQKLDQKVGQELLVRACQLGRNHVINELLALGIDPVKATLNGLNPLLASLIDLNIKFATGGDQIDQKLLLYFIDIGVAIDPIYRSGFPIEHNTTALIEAACDGYLHVVKALIEKGASYELEDDRGKKALLRAAYTARVDVLRYLVTLGCDASLLTDLPDLWFYNLYDDEQAALNFLRSAGASF